MSHALRLSLEPFLSWLFDTRCVACTRRQPHALCDGCRASLGPPVDPRCVRCDHPLPRAGSPCPDCLRLGEPAFEKVVSAFLYRGVARSAVLALKYEDGWRVAELLAAAMCERVRAAAIGVDAVVPVPIDDARRAARGYSPPALLASRLASHLGVPRRAGLLRRRVQGVVQSTADVALRHVQVSGIFEAAPGLEGQRLLLVDDVMTTAATLQAAASALRRQGARVWGAVAARQILRGGRT